MDLESSRPIKVVLHVSIAFDWGDEIDLTKAAELIPAETQTLPRRRRTPPSIAYQTPPLLIKLPSSRTTLGELGERDLETDLTVFDFGAVAVRQRIAFESTREELSRLAAALSPSDEYARRARELSEPVFAKIVPAIKSANWCDLTEEYTIFELSPPLQKSDDKGQVLHDRAWLAGLLRLDDAPLSDDEIQEATRMRLSYGPTDAVLAEWAAAVVIDTDCEDTLRTIEFANVQLLEMRFLDRRVDQALNHAQSLIHPLTNSWLPFWRLQTKPLRVLGDMRIGTVTLFERTGSTLKLVGDQYLARVYRMFAERFRLDEWSASIRTSLDAAESVYEILAQQSATFRIEILEVIVVVLILIEIVLTVVE